MLPRGCNGAGGKSWSQIVKDVSQKTEKVTFAYVLPPEGSDIVAPPDPVLKKGNDKLKITIAGTLTKGSVPFHK